MTEERPPRGLELAAIVGLVALVAFLYLGANVSLAPPGAFDTQLRAGLLPVGTGFFAPVLDILNTIGSLEGGAILTIGLTGLLLGLRRPAAAGAILSTWLAEGAGTVAKELLMRPRPPGAIVQSALGESWSYPSGHVLRAVAVIGVLAWLVASRREWSDRTILAAAMGLLAGVAMGVARVASGAHWPTDVIGGLLLGLVYLVGLALVAAVAGVRRRSRAAARRPPPSPGPGSAGP